MNSSSFSWICRTRSKIIKQSFPRYFNKSRIFRWLIIINNRDSFRKNNLLMNNLLFKILKFFDWKTTRRIKAFVFQKLVECDSDYYCQSSNCNYGFKSIIGKSEKIIDNYSLCSLLLGLKRLFNIPR